ncbi:MAG: hypothetical protein RBU37_28540, partial [Myxococcota bacterium]|nr:hypothetical protein [Myxococcota bacterium]
APAAKPWVLDALRALQHPTLSQWVTHARRFAKSRGGELAVRWQKLDAKEAGRSPIEHFVQARNDWAHLHRGGTHQDLVSAARRVWRLLEDLLDAAGFELYCGNTSLQGVNASAAACKAPSLKTRKHNQLPLTPLLRVFDEKPGKLAVLSKHLYGRQEVGGTGQAPNQQEVGGTGQAPNQQELSYELPSETHRLRSNELQQQIDKVSKCLDITPESWFRLCKTYFEEELGESPATPSAVSIPEIFWTQLQGANAIAELGHRCLKAENPVVFFSADGLRGRGLPHAVKERFPFLVGDDLLSTLRKATALTKKGRCLYLLVEGLSQGMRASLRALETDAELRARLRIVEFPDSQGTLLGRSMGKTGQQALKAALREALGDGFILPVASVLTRYGFLPVGQLDESLLERLCGEERLTPRYDGLELEGYEFAEFDWTLALLLAGEPSKAATRSRVPAPGDALSSEQVKALIATARRSFRDLWSPAELEFLQQAAEIRATEAVPRRAESSSIASAASASQPSPPLPSPSSPDTRPGEDAARDLSRAPSNEHRDATQVPPELPARLQAPSWRLLLEPEAQAAAFEAACEWAQSIELYLSWLEPGDKWGPRWGKLEPFEAKLSRVVTALTGFRSEPELLARLYAANKLRLVLSSDISFAPNLFLFRAGQRLRAMLSSAPFSSTLFNRSLEHWVLFEADQRARQSLELLDFARRCGEQALVPEPGFIEQYRQRRAALAALERAQIAQPKLCQLEPQGELVQVTAAAELASCVQRLRAELERASLGSSRQASLMLGEEKRLVQLGLIESLSFGAALEEDASGAVWLVYTALEAPIPRRLCLSNP